MDRIRKQGEEEKEEKLVIDLVNMNFSIYTIIKTNYTHLLSLYLIVHIYHHL